MARFFDDLEPGKPADPEDVNGRPVPMKRRKQVMAVAGLCLALRHRTDKTRRELTVKEIWREGNNRGLHDKTSNFTGTTLGQGPDALQLDRDGQGIPISYNNLMLMVDAAKPTELEQMLVDEGISRDDFKAWVCSFRVAAGPV